MKRKVTVPALVFSCILCLLLGGLAVLLAVRLAVGTDGMTLLQAQMLIRTRFVGDYDPDTEREAAVQAMVDSLGDRWSVYLPPEQYEQTAVTRENSYVGIGVTIEGVQEGLKIIGVTPGGPAQEAGLLPGEVICGVDGVPVTLANQDESIDRVRGEEGTTVELEILSAEGERRTVTATRRTVQGISAEGTLLEGQVGLLTITNFYTGAAEQARNCLEDLVDQGARALVIDVRNNPGGYVTEMTSLLDTLLPEGPVFRIETYDGHETVFTSDADCIDLPAAVLVNENTFSAAELLAAQMQESVGAKVVGVKTTGKGYAQNLYRLRDGSAINLSNSRYFTGGGVSLIGTGLKPDPYIQMTYEKQLALYYGQLAHEEDSQLQAAIEALDLEL